MIDCSLKLTTPKHATHSHSGRRWLRHTAGNNFPRTGHMIVSSSHPDGRLPIPPLSPEDINASIFSA